MYKEIVGERTIWIARHGNRVDFIDPDWANTADTPDDPGLSPDGLVQARLLGMRLKGENIKHIFCSPFLRAVETANQAAEILDLQIRIEAGLSEWLRSDWFISAPILLSMEKKKELYPRIDAGYKSRVTPRYPELWEDIKRRSARIAKILAEEFDGNLLLIGHGASVETVTAGFLDEICCIESPLCCLIKVVNKGNRWIMELNGDTSHLDKSDEFLLADSSGCSGYV